MEYKIKEYRLEKGLSIEELAEKCGISRTYMNLIEIGKVENISTKVLVKIAKSLDKKIDDILILR
ncbi:helix-turn-helix transcriptional regulator [Faecalicoccus sp.]|uniref:helix-turn-helix transcriptional regulator n=1 Tax=Faecalicoccus sp. TaxID=1971758 RepID=UPI00262BD89F|nr:helix-turn-helix transcriptional regulator [Faecalicoccus sp.]